MSEKAGRRIFAVISFLVLLFTMAPILMLFLGAFSADNFFTFPLRNGLSLRWFKAFLSSREFAASLRVSITVSLSATVIGLCAGVPTAFAIKRFSFRGRDTINTMVMASMTLPRVIWAIALLQFYSTLHFLGSYTGLFLAHSLLVIPYVVRMVLSSLSFINADVENAALSLGATPVKTFFKITMPLIAPGVIVSGFFGFVVSFTDSVVAVFISGVRNITFPVRIYAEQRGQGLDLEAVAGSAIIILVIIVAEMVGEKLFKWSRFI